MSDDELVIAIQTALRADGRNVDAPLPDDARNLSWILWDRWAGALGRVFGVQCQELLGWDVSELLHEAYPRFMRAIFAWDARPGNIRTLLVIVVRSTLRDQARRARYRRTDPLPEVAQPTASLALEEDEQHAVIHAAVHSVFDRLPDSKERSLAECRWFKGASIEELAATTGFTKRRVRRAIREVRERFLESFAVRYPELVDLVAPGWHERDENATDSCHH